MRDIFLRALEQETVERAMQRYVTRVADGLQIEGEVLPLSEERKLKVIALGKAGHTMAAALAGYLSSEWEGVVASPVDVEAKVDGLQYFRGGHPMPNQASLDAADAILKTLAPGDDSSQVIYLLSGGGSASAEKPLDPRMTLEDVVAVNQALVHCGAPIAQINAIRKHLSAIKGGRMSRAAGSARQVSLLISDVPAEVPDALASGPTMADPTTVDDCYVIAEKYKLLAEFPATVRGIFERRELQETPKASDTAFMRSRWLTILSNASLVAAAQKQAVGMGFTVQVDSGCDDWDYTSASEYLLKRLRSMRQGGQPVCLISGGEVTVRVSSGGVGGRNQQFALACAEQIRGENIAVLSAGSDGVDGNSPAAGGVVDGTTIERAGARGLSVRAALERFDAYPLLEALGDAVLTGPTGNNLRDLRILVAW
ncbi:MAG: DUF4147 domain-containing protein [Acidobacteriales bacterium]|nr:DUF4147 domain-containing protein [Terriglobales bacterium]